MSAAAYIAILAVVCVLCTTAGVGLALVIARRFCTNDERTLVAQDAERRITNLNRTAQEEILSIALRRARGRLHGDPYAPRTIDGEWR